MNRKEQRRIVACFYSGRNTCLALSIARDGFFQKRGDHDQVSLTSKTLTGPTYSLPILSQHLYFITFAVSLRLTIFQQCQQMSSPKQRSISEIRSIEFLVLAVDDLLQFVEQLVEGLGDVVGSGGMVGAEVVGGLPLPDHIVSGGVVGSGVVVEDALLHQEISEPDAPGKSPQVLHLDVVLPEEIEQLVGLIVNDGQDLLPSHPWVVRPVGNGPRVVVAIESSEHDTQSIIQILLGY